VNFEHKIPENSCFFQGHVGQFFTEKKLSFKIISNFQNNEYEMNINEEKYKPVLAKMINSNLPEFEGGRNKFYSPNDILIWDIKLIEDSGDGAGHSGKFQIYPTTAICTENGCNKYFDLRKGKNCTHSNTTKWEQIKFLKFCKDCGTNTPLHIGSNLGTKCPNCSKEKSLNILEWKRKLELLSYTVKCDGCNKSRMLELRMCNHSENTSFSPKAKASRFVGILSRSGTIVHPLVFSIPDIPDHDEIDPQTGRQKPIRRITSEAFRYFFPEEEEAIIRFPELMDSLLKDSEFWMLPRVKTISEESGISLKSIIEDHDHSNFSILIKQVIVQAKVSTDSPSADKELIENRYGIKNINNAIKSLSDMKYTEEDLQASYLLEETYPSLFKNKEVGNMVFPKKKSQPASVCLEDYSKFLQDYGLKKIVHVANLTMIQSLLGVIKGSTRNQPPLFSVISAPKPNQEKAVVYLRNFNTEGIVFHLDFTKILDWFDDNYETLGVLPNIPEEHSKNPKTKYRYLVTISKTFCSSARTLLHTYAHMLIQESAVHTGLDTASLSENINVPNALIFIYSTSPINIGGLESTYDHHINDWLSRMAELASDCPQDPSCMIDEDGSCNACSYIEEFVCHNFNQDLDRSTLVGKSSRFLKGYINAH
jgi:hypothetical protein